MLKKTPTSKLVIPLLTLLAIVATALVGWLPSVLADPIPAPLPGLPFSIASAIHPDTVIDLARGGTSEGAEVLVAHIVGPPSPYEVFRWMPSALDPNYGYIASMLDQNAILAIQAGPDGSYSKGAAIVVWGKDTQQGLPADDNQLWKFDQGKIKSRLCEEVDKLDGCLVIGLPNGNTDSHLVAWSSTDSAPDQIWLPVPPR